MAFLFRLVLTPSPLLLSRTEHNVCRLHSAGTPTRLLPLSDRLPGRRSFPVDIQVILGSGGASVKMEDEYKRLPVVSRNLAVRFFTDENRLAFGSSKSSSGTYDGRDV